MPHQSGHDAFHRSFVRYQTCAHIFWKQMNRFWCKLAQLVRGARAWNVQLRGSAGQMSRLQEAEVRFGDLADTSFSILLGRVSNIDVEMLRVRNRRWTCAWWESWWCCWSCKSRRRQRCSVLASSLLRSFVPASDRSTLTLPSQIEVTFHVIKKHNNAGTVNIRILSQAKPELWWSTWPVPLMGLYTVREPTQSHHSGNIK